MNLKQWISISAIIYGVFMSHSLFATTDTVLATAQAPTLTPYYLFHDAGLTYKNGVAYIWVIVKAPEGWPARDCDHEWDRIHCRFETGYFALPHDSVIFDGNKRLKYIGNNQYLTIAKRKNIPFFDTWKINSSAQVQVEEGFNSAGILVFY